MFFVFNGRVRNGAVAYMVLEKVVDVCFVEFVSLKGGAGGAPAPDVVS